MGTSLEEEDGLDENDEGIDRNNNPLLYMILFHAVPPPQLLVSLKMYIQRREEARHYCEKISIYYYATCLNTQLTFVNSVAVGDEVGDFSRDGDGGGEEEVVDEDDDVGTKDDDLLVAILGGYRSSRGSFFWCYPASLLITTV